MNQTEYIKGIKSEILKLDSLNTELENLTSMCAAFEAAFRNGGFSADTYSRGFTLFFELLCNFNSEHAALSSYLCDTYLQGEPTEV